MPKSSLPINPWPVGLLRELFALGMMMNGKSKHRFIVSWGDGGGHAWEVESSVECSAAKWTASPEAWLQGFQADAASVGTRLAARSFQEGSAPGQARGLHQPAQSPAWPPHRDGRAAFSGMDGHSVSRQPRAASEGAEGAPLPGEKRGKEGGDRKGTDGCHGPTGSRAPRRLLISSSQQPSGRIRLSSLGDRQVQTQVQGNRPRDFDSGLSDARTVLFSIC